MHFSPYRARPGERIEPRTLSEEAQLLPFHAFVWLASLARLITAVVRHEFFGPELTLSLMVAILLPALARRGLREIVTRVGAASRKNKES